MFSMLRTCLLQLSEPIPVSAPSRMSLSHLYRKVSQAVIPQAFESSAPLKRAVALHVDVLLERCAEAVLAECQRSISASLEALGPRVTSPQHFREARRDALTKFDTRAARGRMSALHPRTVPQTTRKALREETIRLFDGNTASLRRLLTQTASLPVQPGHSLQAAQQAAARAAYQPDSDPISPCPPFPLLPDPDTAPPSPAPLKPGHQSGHPNRDHASSNGRPSAPRHPTHVPDMSPVTRRAHAPVPKLMSLKVQPVPLMSITVQAPAQRGVTLGGGPLPGDHTGATPMDTDAGPESAFLSPILPSQPATQSGQNPCPLISDPVDKLMAEYAWLDSPSPTASLSLETDFCPVTPGVQSSGVAGSMVRPVATQAAPVPANRDWPTSREEGMEENWDIECSQQSLQPGQSKCHPSPITVDLTVDSTQARPTHTKRAFTLVAPRPRRPLQPLERSAPVKASNKRGPSTTCFTPPPSPALVGASKRARTLSVPDTPPQGNPTLNGLHSTPVPDTSRGTHKLGPLTSLAVPVTSNQASPPAPGKTSAPPPPLPHPATHPALSYQGPQRQVIGAKDPLSNMFPCEIIIQGRKFHSAEQAFHFYKVGRAGRKDLRSLVLSAPTGYQAKNAARPSKTPATLKKCTYGMLRTLREILRHKARQVPQFRDALLDSVDSQLTHPVNDPFWGSFSKPNKYTPKTPGLDWHARALTHLRAELLTGENLPPAGDPGAFPITEEPPLDFMEAPCTPPRSALLPTTPAPTEATLP
jgi:predicted NAD-dependent protein-ADP-ribosyltransferase YbiA (DUF1768 family)